MLESHDSSGRCSRRFQAAKTAPSIKQMCPESPKGSPGEITALARSRDQNGSVPCAAGPHTSLCAALRSKCDLALVFLDFLELGVDHVVLLLAPAARRCTRA